MRQYVALILFAVCLTGLYAMPTGNGTEDDPYLIATLDDLEWMSTGMGSQYLDKNFLQICDIDASATAFWNFNLLKLVYEGFFPIGMLYDEFHGRYDGQGYTINGLTVHRIDQVGMFAQVRCDDQSNITDIRNVNLTNVNFSGRDYVGGIVGELNTDSGMTATIHNCHVSGTIWSDGNSVGGIVGYCNKATIENCSSSAYITCNSNPYGHVGGIAGHLHDTCNILYCKNTGNINTNYDSVGGIAGYNTGTSTINGCFNSGSITCASRCGGIIGENDRKVVITNTVNTGTVSATSYVGGITGFEGCYIYNPSVYRKCLNSGVVSGALRGGLIAYREYETSNVTVSGCFWDTETSGITYTAVGGTGLTTQELQTDFSLYVNAGWDFDLNHIGYSSTATWCFDGRNASYPALTCMGGFNYPALPASGSGTSESPYQISNLANLLWLTKDSSVWDSDFLLTSDIDAGTLSNVTGGATSIGSNSDRFTGSFDGNGHTISGYYNNHITTDCTGFFGYAYTAQISDLILVDSSVKGATSVGGLVGTLSHSTITGCSVSGYVDGTTNVSGLVGQLWGYSTVSECVSTVFVEGGTRVGGIVGFQQGGAVNRCFSSGDVEGANSVGGMIGSSSPCSPYTCTVRDCYSICYIDGGGTNYGGFVGYLEGTTVTHCYSRGRIDGSGTSGGFAATASGSTVTGCFWDVERSGKTTSAAGTGRTTAAMKTRSNYLNAGWDFAGETANGPDDFWNMDGVNNEGYPYLSWQPYDPIALTPPQNVAISTSSASVTITWSAAQYANCYKILSCDTPDGVFTEDSSGAFDGTSWSAPTPDGKRFYRVKAVRDLGR